MRCYKRCDKTSYIHAQKLLLAACIRCCGGWFAGRTTNLQLRSLWCTSRHCAIATRPAPAIQPARRAELPLAYAWSSIALLQPECSGGSYSHSAQIHSCICGCIIRVRILVKSMQCPLFSKRGFKKWWGQHTPYKN